MPTTMMIRDVEDADLTKLWEYLTEYPRPDTTNPLYFCQRLVEDVTGRIVAAGFVRLTSEGLVVVNPDAPLVSKTRAVRALIADMKDITLSRGMDECHVFASENIEKLLTRLGFKPCKGKPMVTIYG